MKFPRAGLPLLIILISVTPFLLAGCSVFQPVGDFFSQRYVNTLSYFNTFYNAKRLYSEAVVELEEAEKRHRQQRREGAVEIPQQTKQKFNDVIEKCSRLLHQYPTSKYAEDAVLMIGQSYYKMRQNVQAERKFLELLAEFPDSRLVPESQLLLAKTLRRMNRNDEAQVALRNLVDRLESRRDLDVSALALIELGDIEKKAGNLNNAAEEFLNAIDVARDREIRTQARFHLANILYSLGRVDEAFEQYSEVVDDRPTSRILYESQIARSRILMMNQEYERAIDLLEGLLTDLQLADYISRIELEAAHVYRDQGLLDKAIHQYVYVDTTHSQTIVSTEAQYALATIYKDTLGNFHKATEYYAKVARSTPATDIAQSAQRYNDQLTRYSQHKNEIARLDSIIAMKKIRLNDIESELLANRENTDTTRIIDNDTLGVDMDNDTLGVDMKEDLDELESPEDLQNEIVSGTEELIRHYADLAGLFYIEMELPDSAFYYYSRLVDKFPDSHFAPQALYALADIIRSAGDTGYSIVEVNASADIPLDRNSLYLMLIEQYPDSEFSVEAKRILGMEVPAAEPDPMEEVYSQAEQNLVDGRYEDALNLFEYIVTENTESQYTARSCYAIGWMYENIFMEPDSAVVYYKRILDKHPESRYASAVNPKIDAWLQQLAEEERLREEEEKSEQEENGEEEETDHMADQPEKKENEYPSQPELPPVPPNNFIEPEEIPDTTRTEKQNED